MFKTIGFLSREVGFLAKKWVLLMKKTNPYGKSIGKSPKTAKIGRKIAKSGWISTIFVENLTKHQARALADVHAALDYVRFARPAVVIVENVEHAELHAHMDMMLLGIAGYAWRSVVVDPRDVGGFAARRRRYWVGVRAT